MKDIEEPEGVQPPERLGAVGPLELSRLRDGSLEDDAARHRADGESDEKPDGQLERAEEAPQALGDVVEKSQNTFRPG
jgi:hypothetical protein